MKFEIPVGLIVAYAGPFVPNGWLACDGRTVSRDTFKDLYACIGSRYGDGNNVNTFNLPDLRGRFPLGLDNMGGNAANRVTSPQASRLGHGAGEQDHTLTLKEMPEHDHKMLLGEIVVRDAEPPVFADSIPPGAAEGSAWLRDVEGLYRSPQGEDAPHNIMNPYLTVNYLIFVGAATAQVQAAEFRP